MNTEIITFPTLERILALLEDCSAKMERIKHFIELMDDVVGYETKKLQRMESTPEIMGETFLSMVDTFRLDTMLRADQIEEAYLMCQTMKRGGQSA